MAEAIRLHTEVTGTPPARLVHRALLGQHRAAGRQTKAASTMSPTAMPTICPTGSSFDGTRSADRPLHARRQRHALCHAAGFQRGRPVLRLSARTASTRSMPRAREGAPKMMSIGLHCRLIGRPGRDHGAETVHRVCRKVMTDVWFARRIDIARHWAATHPPKRRDRPSRNGPRHFRRHASAASSNILPGSPSARMTLELGPAHDTAAGLHNALARIFRSASRRRTPGRPDRPPRSCGQAGRGQAPDRRKHRRTGQRRA